VVPPSAEASYLNNPEPVYPRASRRQHQEGRVLLSVHVLHTGAVGDIQLKRSSGFPLLDEAALTAVRAWRFVPAKRAGEPVAYWYVLPIDFSLDR
jgi:protein TonB